jgi:indole-3-glycerol phosphate synthase
VSARSVSRLDQIVAQTRDEVARRKRQLAPDELAQSAAAVVAERASAGPGRGLRASLRQAPIAVIAEFKRRSPSAGALREGADVAEVVGAYERGGARALSVLTEGPNFDGSLEDLRRARAASELPILRKDFVIDVYQLHEAVLAGADAVLLIVAALAAPALGELHEQAAALGLEALVEVHDETELAVALGRGATLIGINNRDLRDFSVDVARSSRLARALPDGVTVVSESGIHSSDQLLALQRDGIDAVLIGESLMRARDPQGALRGLLSALEGSVGADATPAGKI